MNTSELANQLTSETLITPRNEIVLLEWVEKASTIVLPGKTKGSGHFVVVSIGPGRITEEGERVPTSFLQVGDKATLQGPGRAFEANGRKYMLVPENMVWSVYTGEISAPSAD